jgi:hypothetical protein
MIQGMNIRHCARSSSCRDWRRCACGRPTQHKIEWVVHTKNPFAGPEQVLRYLSHYAHRVAISNRRLLSTDDNRVAFRWKDYRIDGRRQ